MWSVAMVPALGLSRLGFCFFFFSSRRRHTRFACDWSSDVCSSDLFTSPMSRQSSVVNSGVAKVAPLVEMTTEDWRLMVDVNLTGVFNGCRAAAPHLIAQRSGKVINVASVLGQVGLPGYTIYAATKGGVIALTRALGVEWARHNVQVNAIAPGWFATPMTDDAFADPKINERLTRDVPMRRIGRPEEIGPLAVLLASSASDFMTGQTIFLDGGQSAA